MRHTSQTYELLDRSDRILRQLDPLLPAQHPQFASEFLRPRDQAAVTRDLVVLDRLRGSNQRGIEDRLVFHPGPRRRQGRRHAGAELDFPNPLFAGL